MFQVLYMYYDDYTVLSNRQEYARSKQKRNAALQVRTQGFGALQSSTRRFVCLCVYESTTDVCTISLMLHRTGISTPYTGANGARMHSPQNLKRKSGDPTRSQ